MRRMMRRGRMKENVLGGNRESIVGFGRSGGEGRGCCRWGCCTILEWKGEEGKEMRGKEKREKIVGDVVVVVVDARKRVWLLRELSKEDCLESEG